MNQKLFIGLISSFIVVVLLFLYFFFFSVSNNNPHAIDIVPNNASIILETRNFESTIQSIISKKFFNQINKAAKLNELTEDILIIDSLLNTDKNFNEWKQSKRTTLSIHTDKSNNIHLFMAIEIEENPDVTETFKWLTENYRNQFKINKRLYNKEFIYDFTDFKGSNNFSISIKKGILMFAFEGSLVEEALIKCKYFNSYANTGLKSLNFVKSLTSDFNIYINYKNIESFFNSFINETHANAFSFMPSIANWSGGDINMKENSLLVSGASITDDSLFQFLDIFSDQIPSSQSITDKLPSSTNFYLLQNVSNIVTYQKNLFEYLGSNNTLNQYKIYNDSIEQNLNIKLNEAFVPSLGNNYLIANLNANGLSTDSSWVGVFAPQNLNEFINSAKCIEAKIKTSSNDTIDSTEQNSSKFNFMPIGNVLKYYCSGFEKLTINYYCINNGLIFFASNTQLLQHTLDKMTENNTLQSLESYKEAKSILSSQNSVEVMVFNKNAINLVNTFGNSSMVSSVSINKGYYQKAEIFAAQFASQGEKTFSTQLLLQFNKSETNVTELIWEANIDTCIISKPYFVNNSNTNEQVILVQDAKFNMYCFDKDGKQLWKVKLSSAIISEIHQLDIFKNGTTEYLFNTNNQLFLIDANGKNSQNFPIWIPAATQLPISVFDFLSDHSYQIYVAGKYYKIWQYDCKGMLQAGFNPKEIWPNAIQPIRGFTLGNENTIYSLNEKGKIDFYLSNGKKSTIIKLDSSITYKYINHKQIDTGTVRFYCLDSTNQLIVLNAFSNGKIRPISEYLIKSNIGFEVLNNKNSNDENYFIKTNNAYEFYNQKMELGFSYKWSDSTLDNRPEIVNLDGKMSIAYLSQINCELNISDSKGKPYSMFKFKGCKQFGFGNLYSDADMYLALGSNENKLFVYRVK
ncbi:MAG: hypothetical protein WCK82_02470 [Bacteroidota bacterium]